MSKVRDIGGAWLWSRASVSPTMSDDAQGSVDGMAMEREVNLAAPAGFILPDLDGLAGLHCEPPVTFDL